MSRGHGASAVLSGLTALVCTFAPATHIQARFSSASSGQGGAKATVLTAPPPPTLVSVLAVLTNCLITVSWPAPPAGQRYSILRTNGTTSVIVNPTTSSGSTVDVILLAALVGSPTYAIRTDLAVDPLWVKSSTVVTANGC